MSINPNAILPKPDVFSPEFILSAAIMEKVFLERRVMEPYREELIEKYPESFLFGGYEQEYAMDNRLYREAPTAETFGNRGSVLLGVLLLELDEVLKEVKAIKDTLQAFDRKLDRILRRCRIITRVIKTQTNRILTVGQSVFNVLRGQMNTIEEWLINQHAEINRFRQQFRFDDTRILNAIQASQNLVTHTINETSINLLQTLQTSIQNATSNVQSNLTRLIDAHFDDIKRLLDYLLLFIEEQKTQLMEPLQTLLARIPEDLVARLETLQQTLHEIKELFPEDFKTRFEALYDLITNELMMLLRRIDTNVRDHVMTDLRTLLQRIPVSIQDLFDSLYNHISTTSTNTRNVITEAIAVLAEEIAVIRAELIAIGVLMEENTFSILLAIAGVAGTIEVEVIGALAWLKAHISSLEVTLHSIQDKVDGLVEAITHRMKQLLESKWTEIREYIKKQYKHWLEEASDAVSLKIVGESYYKWVSTNTFYPTVVFIFLEQNTSNCPRKTQVKARLAKHHEELTPEDITRLTHFDSLYQSMIYKHGAVRGNYVSTSKHFKTTVYGEDEHTITTLLTNVSEVVDDKYERKNLTLTYGLRKAAQPRKTKTFGPNVEMIQEYRTKFTVKLNRVVLLVQNTNQPIIIWKEHMENSHAKEI